MFCAWGHVPIPCCSCKLARVLWASRGNMTGRLQGGKHSSWLYLAALSCIPHLHGQTACSIWLVALLASQHTPWLLCLQEDEKLTMRLAAYAPMPLSTNNPPASSAGTSSSSPDFKVGPLMEQNWTSPQQLPPACRVMSDGFLQLQCSAHSAQRDGQSTGHRDSCGLDLQHLYMAWTVWKVGCCARYASGCCHCHHPAPGTGCNYMSLFAEDACASGVDRHSKQTASPADRLKGTVKCISPIISGFGSKRVAC